MRSVGVVLASLVVAACQAPMTWVKPGATQAEFNTDRFQCMQGSQQQSSSIYVGRYGGYGSSGQTTNGPLFDACMTAHSWSLQNKADVERQAGSPDIQAALKANAESVEQEVCGNPKFGPYYAKTACNARKMTFEQLADATRISPEVKTVFVDLRRAIDAKVQENIELLSKTSPVGAKRANLFMTTYKPQNDRNNLDLYNHVITWGEYNKRRQDIASDYAAAAGRITS